MTQERNDLPKLASPAQRALAGAGITHLDQLTQISEAELLQLHGIGPNAIKSLRQALADKGLTFRPENKQTNRSMPESVIIPEIPYPDVRQAVDWLCRCFGFAERLRIGDHRAQLSFAGGSLVVTAQGGSPAPKCSIMVRVSDVDRHHAHATRLGVRILTPPTDYPYGERQYTAEDLAGHRWTFSQTIQDVDPSAWGGVLYE